MKTILKIIAAAGGLEWLKQDGNYINIKNYPYMRLVIECVGTGPRGMPLISVAHYGEQNGDAMRDPEMTFEWTRAPIGREWIVGDVNLLPVSFRNDYAGVCQEGEAAAVFQKGGVGQVLTRPKLVKELEAFALIWDKNIKEQGFLEVFSGRASEENPQSQRMQQQAVACAAENNAEKWFDNFVS